MQPSQCPPRLPSSPTAVLPPSPLQPHRRSCLDTSASVSSSPRHRLPPLFIARLSPPTVLDGGDVSRRVLCTCQVIARRRWTRRGAGCPPSASPATATPPSWWIAG